MFFEIDSNVHVPQRQHFTGELRVYSTVNIPLQYWCIRSITACMHTADLSAIKRCR